MSKKNQMVRVPVTDNEEWRIELLAFVGFHYDTIARKIYGNGDMDYEPTQSEVRRVGRIARSLDCSPVNYRRGANPFAIKILKNFGRCVARRIPDTPRFLLPKPQKPQ